MWVVEVEPPLVKKIPKRAAETIERAICRVRGQNVMLDADLAALYQVDVRVLNQAVRRNADRFPSDFMFKLTAEEAASLRSQIVILESGRGRYRKYHPLVFTEQGVAMLSSVLRSPRAIRVNIEIMRGSASPDVLTEIDGPTLIHGTQGFHGQRIQLPARHGAWPRREFLEERYSLFRRLA